ncbi:methyltransferase-like protein 25B [Culex pipiens pallens]|uniref:methyltransferase-like protein 25B n=1 Tax=Culex pipiens pallens TaxID=42434 RepID=UPI001954D9DB|nr:methyltransferase-like protein 25B [Culex pipiens pallens]
MTVKFNSEFNFVTYFNESVAFLSQHSWIFEQSNTKFVQNGTLDRIPAEWSADLESASNDEFNKIPLGYLNENWSHSFRQFLQSCFGLYVNYELFSGSKETRATLKGVGPKKMHEISNLTALIKDVCSQDEILLDFGSGLGYLSQNLNQKHDFKVLGIEGDEYRVQTSIQRQQQLFPNSTSKVKFVQHFIETDSFELIQQTAVAKLGNSIDQNYTIIGLHSCADLSITAIKMFLTHKPVTKLVIMPCCYHKLKPENEECTSFSNIPLSDQLRDAIAQFPNFLGRPFLRLGCQQTSARWANLTEHEHETHGKAMFERSLLEAILSEGETVTVNKANRNSRDVLERLTVQREGQDWSWSDEHREKLEIWMEKYPQGSELAAYLTCLQTCLQSLCENLILLDRMCYLKAKSSKRDLTIRTDLIKLSNDHLSPRCFVIVAEKNTNQ